MDNAASVGKGGREHIPFRPESPFPSRLYAGDAPATALGSPLALQPTGILLQELSKVFRKFSEFLEPGYDYVRKGSYASSANTGWLQQALYGKNILRTKASPHFGRRVIMESMKWRSLPESSSGIDARPLRDIYRERKESIAQYVPAETQAIHAAAVAELQARNLAAGVLRVGAQAPSFDLLNHEGNSVRSAELLARGRLVICFIRGRWCPFCVAQMEAMNLAVPLIQAAGASLLAISPQTVKQSYFMRDQHKLQFPLLTDAGTKLARQFGLTYRVSAAQAAVYRRAFVNLPFINGDYSWELAIPATFVIDRDAVIVYASAKEDYTERPEPGEVVRVLTHLSL